MKYEKFLREFKWKVKWFQSNEKPVSNSESSESNKREKTEFKIWEYLHNRAGSKPKRKRSENLWKFSKYPSEKPKKNPKN